MPPPSPELMQDMGGKMQKAGKSGTIDPEDLRKAMKQSEAAMAAILTPEEMLDYNLRFSMTAGGMRAQLAGFAPSEQEFLVARSKIFPPERAVK